MSEYLDERKEILKNIDFVKYLLDKNMNIENYDNKTTTQLYNILESYKKDYNSSNKVLFRINIKIYNGNTNSVSLGYVSVCNKVTTHLYENKLFKSYADAVDYIKNEFKVPDNCIILENVCEKLTF